MAVSILRKCQLPVAEVTGLYAFQRKQANARRLSAKFDAMRTPSDNNTMQRRITRYLPAGDARLGRERI
jgi:hypothetical protein